jgi:YbbR domain-containing protein
MRIDINRLVENRKATAILSVLIAVIMWFAVVFSVDTEGQHTITEVPVQLNAAGSTAGRLDLKPLIAEDSPIYVSVTISGKRSVIGNVTAEDIYVTAPIGGILTPDVYTLEFSGADIHKKGFEVVSINPATYDVIFDAWVPRILDVSFPIEGLTIPEDYVMDNVMLRPETIELLGPDSILSTLKSATISYDFDEPLTSTFNTTLPLEFYDYSDNPIELDPDFVRASEQGGGELSLPASVEVTIPVLKRKTLPVTIRLTNQPPGFNLDSLSYTLSEQEMTLAGPEREIDSREEFSLGLIDMREIEPGFEKQIDVPTPTGYRNLHDIETITVSFPLPGYDKKLLNITNIEITNKPSGYTITADTRQIRGVAIVGPASVLRSLTAADFVAEIDMNDVDLITGQRSAAVKIRPLNRDDVWAFGKYEAFITVREG